jgi:hypothetical protein
MQAATLTDPLTTNRLPLRSQWDAQRLYPKVTHRSPHKLPKVSMRMVLEPGSNQQPDCKKANKIRCNIDACIWQDKNVPEWRSKSVPPVATIHASLPSCC